jgi:hypothetical protein
MVTGILTKNVRRTLAPFARILVITLDFIGGRDKRWFIFLIEFHSKHTFMIFIFKFTWFCFFTNVIYCINVVTSIFKQAGSGSQDGGAGTSSTFSLIEANYDKDHQAKALSEQQRSLRALRVRTHHPHSWDDRYAMYIRRAGFLGIVRVYNSTLLTLDPALLTAFVDR